MRMSAVSIKNNRYEIYVGKKRYKINQEVNNRFVSLLFFCKCPITSVLLPNQFTYIWLKLNHTEGCVSTDVITPFFIYSILNNTTIYDFLSTKNKTI